MKRVIIIISVIFTVGCVTLDENDRAHIQPNEYYRSEADLNGACITIYTGMAPIQYYRLLNGMGRIQVTTDNRFAQQCRGVLTSSDQHVNQVWTDFYQCISKANYAIDHILVCPVEESIKNRYIAEAKALRALLYLRLVKLYGDMPLYMSFDTSTDDVYPAPMKEVYTTIIDDLTWAAENGHEPGWKRGRMDRTGAKMVLADAYVTCASSAAHYNPSTSARALKPYYTAFADSIPFYYGHVKRITEEIISGTAYKLISSGQWSDLWGLSESHDSRNNEEYVLSPQTIVGLYSEGHSYVPVDSEYSPAHTGIFGHVAYEHVVSYDRNDERFKQHMFSYRTIVPNNAGNYRYLQWFRDLDNPDNLLTFSGTITFPGDPIEYRQARHTALYPTKFYDRTYTDPGMDGEACVIQYYRIAEAYLWFAEAENELNGMTQAAVEKINAIRERVNVPIYSEGQFTQAEFRGKLIDEYCWEFALEGKDFHVLTRFGQLEERCKGVETTSDGTTFPGLDPNNPRPRNADNYWLPYPINEKQLNKYMTAYRMNYE